MNCYVPTGRSIALVKPCLQLCSRAALRKGTGPANPFRCSMSQAQAADGSQEAVAEAVIDRYGFRLSSSGCCRR